MSAKRRQGLSSTPPKNEARPLGIAAPKSTKKSPATVKPTVDTQRDDVVSSSPSVEEAPSTAPRDNESSTQSVNVNRASEVHMIVQFRKSNKPRKSSSVVYLPTNGLRGSLRCAKTFFANGEAPNELSVDSDAFATPRAKMTAEERKLARQNAPKLTPAEKLAKLEERAARLKKKIEAQQLVSA